jgi:pyruvate dehydrogenase E2 component (dihydrolipoamide acetyltransferase)
MRVIALDLPGHGQSDARLPGASLQAMADFVARFLDALAVDQVHAVGHSMGGAIAAELARQSPQRVASVALVGSAGLGPDINVGYTQGFVTATSRRELKPVLEQLFADPELVTRQLVDDVLKYKRLDGVEPLLHELGNALFGNGTQASQPARELPGPRTLVLWGAQDRVIPAAHAQAAPAGAQVHVFDDAGHMVMMEKASDFNALLRQHLQRAGGAA